MNPKEILPADIFGSSVIFPLLSAHDLLSHELERRTGLSQTRLMILILFRGGATFNQNQLATALGADRTVVHRTLKSMIEEKLVLEERVEGRRAITLKLSARGEDLRKDVVSARRAIDRKIQDALGDKDFRHIIKILQALGEVF